MTRDRDILVLLNDVARLVRIEADKRARAHGMTRAQWLILTRVEHTPGMSQRELAELLEVEPITVGRLVDRLETRGVVERRPDPQDRRIWRLHLLPEASQVLGPLDVQREAIRDLISCGIDNVRLEHAIDALQQMRANILAHRRTPSADDPPSADRPEGLQRTA